MNIHEGKGTQPMGEHRLLLATTNQHKIVEFRAILSGIPCIVVSPHDLGLDVRIQETGSTFAENAVLKAIAYAEASGLPALADDSGLEIDALNGEPGIYSSRWAGEDVPYPERFRMLFERLSDVPEASRTARYRCVIAIAGPAPFGLYDVVEGTLEGRIAHAPAGNGGFGYDPIFLVPDLNSTVAQMTAEEKHRISHRGKAGAAAAAILARWPDNGNGSTCA
jgi:XTP/dITP diphosphohydrolase